MILVLYEKKQQRNAVERVAQLAELLSYMQAVVSSSLAALNIFCPFAPKSQRKLSRIEVSICWPHF